MDFRRGRIEDGLTAAQLRLRERLSAWAEAELEGFGADRGGGVSGDGAAGGGAAGDGAAGDEAVAAVFRKLAAGGVFRYAAPREFGGVRRSVQARDLCVVREALAAVSPLADTLFAVQALAAYPLALAGTPVQQRRYLPRLAAGRDIGAFALTEPEAGSDPAAVRLRARKRGGSYVLDGVKSLISNAGLAHLYVVFGSTHPARKGNGVSAFVVEAAAPGVAVRERLALISPHPIGTVAFEGCRVPEGQLLGEPGKGLGVALGTLEALRCSVGAAAVGMAGRALAEAVGYARERSQFGRALSRFPGHPVQDRGHGHGTGGGAPAGLPGRAGPRPARARPGPEVVHGQAVRHRGGPAHRGRGAADSRGPRTGGGQRDRAALP